MLPIGYITLIYQEIQDVPTFAKEIGLQKMVNLYNEAIRLFSVKAGHMKVFAFYNENEKEKTVIKYTILGEDYKKAPIGELIYIPAQRRLDVWILGLPQPMIQFKERRAVFKNYALILDKLGIDKSFEKLYTLL